MSPSPADSTDPREAGEPAAADRFAGTESHYATARPGYGDETLDYLRERFALDESSRVLDLGCGTGQLTLPLAAHVGEVVGVDPNAEMLRHAERSATEEGCENVRWLVGADADLLSLAESGALAPEGGDADRGDSTRFHLTTMGRSFHWMDGPRTLAALHDLTEPGGGVALLTDHEWLTKGTDGWQADVYDVVAEYVEDLPDRVDPDNVEYDDPWDDLLVAHGFTDVATETIAVEREWTVDRAVGYVFSLSFVSSALGDRDGDALDADLRATLDDLGAEPFVQQTDVTVISGKRAP